MRATSGIGWSWWRTVGAVAALGAAARLIALRATPDYRPIHDDKAYTLVAESLRHFGHYPFNELPGGRLELSAYRPPGWPATLAALFEATDGLDVHAARLLLVALGTLACVVAVWIGRRLGGPAAGLAAGVALALAPLVVMTGASLQSETLFIFLTLAAVAAALEARARGGAVGWALGAGTLAGAAALTRANGLALVPVVAWVAMAPGAGAPATRRRWAAAGLAAIAATLVIAPWTIRNAQVLDRFVPVSTGMGNTLAGTYNDRSLHTNARWLEPRRNPQYAPLFRRMGPSAALDGALARAAVHWTLRHPTYPLVVVGFNSARLLGFDGPDWAAFSLYTMSLDVGPGTVVWLGTLVVTLFALVAVARPALRRRFAPLLPVAAVLLLTTAPLNGEMRLGAPLQAVLAILAGTAVADIVAATRRSRLGRR